jgi:hypothetical protein
MQPDISPPDIYGPDSASLGGGFVGLKVYQCLNWAQDENHGGDISTVRVYDGLYKIFDRIGRAVNIAGGAQYRKTHWKNVSDGAWENVYLTIVTNASSTAPRDLISIAVGTKTDFITDKPNEGSFTSTRAGPVTVASGDYAAIWIKESLTAGGETPERYNNINVVIELQE